LADSVSAPVGSLNPFTSIWLANCWSEHLSAFDWLKSPF
jgi:hypothetical protein